MFGWQNSPFLCFLVFGPYVQYLRELGFKCFIYYDDLVIAISEENERPSDETAQMRVSFILEMLNDTGAQLSEKSFFCPTQNLIYLGKLLNLKLNIVLPTCQKIKKIIDLIIKAHKEKKVSLKFLLSLKGIFIFIKSSRSHYITGEINKKLSKITKAFPKKIITKKDTKELNKTLINIDNKMLNLFHTWNECILDCFTCPEGRKISGTLMLQADTSRDAGGSFLITQREMLTFTHIQ